MWILMGGENTSWLSEELNRNKNVCCEMQITREEERLVDLVEELFRQKQESVLWNAD